jgi:hypothetical protein
MKSPYQVNQVFNNDLGVMVWSLTRIDGVKLDTDGAIAFNFDNEADAVAALQELSRQYYAGK